MAIVEAQEPALFAETEIRFSSPIDNCILYEAYPSVIAPESGQSGRKKYLEILTENLQKGDYETLHVGAIWIPPIYEDAGGNFDQGYDVADPKKISEKFGTIEQFDIFVKEAHKMGIRVVMDLVANHSSVLDPDYQEAISTPDNPKQLMYLFHEDTPDGYPPSQQMNAFGKLGWQRVVCGMGENAKAKWVWSSFSPEGQRDYNWADPTVQEKMRRVIDFWKQHGVDGFRGDAMPFIKHYEGQIPEDILMLNGSHVMEHVAQIATAIGPQGLLIPEGSLDDVMDEIQNIPPTEDVINIVLDGMFQYYFIQTESACMISPVYFLPYFLNWSDASNIKLFYDTFYKRVPKDAASTFLISDHDKSGRAFSRLPSVLVTRQAKVESYRAGVTVVYNGDEIGQRDDKGPTTDILQRDRARRAADPEEANRQKENPESEWNYSVALGKIKQEIPAFTKGRYEALELGQDVYGYVLRHPEGDLLIVHTSCVDDKGRDIPLPDHLFKGFTKDTQVLLSNYMDTNEDTLQDQKIHLRPSETIIVKLS